MTNSSLQSVNVSGSAHLGGGKYAEIRCAGSAHISADLEANRIHCSGSLHSQGALRGDDVHVSGSAAIGSGLNVGQARISGSLKVDGDLVVRQAASVSGSAKISGKLSGETFRCSGSLQVDQEVALESLSVSGAIQCPGMVTAESIRLTAGGWTSHVGELAGSSIVVEDPWGRGGTVWHRVWGERLGRVLVSEVSGDQVQLIQTTAKLVRGDDITIGRGCRVDRVEYRKTLSVDPDAWVGESSRVL